MAIYQKKFAIWLKLEYFGFKNKTVKITDTLRQNVKMKITSALSIPIKLLGYKF